MNYSLYLIRNTKQPKLQQKGSFVAERGEARMTSPSLRVWCVDCGAAWNYYEKKYETCSQTTIQTQGGVCPTCFGLGTITVSSVPVEAEEQEVQDGKAE